jgi:hypothetical protein
MEVLKKGGLGTSHKMVLENGTTVVVKRVRDVAARHGTSSPCPWRPQSTTTWCACTTYYSKDKKMLVLDYLLSGNLSAPRTRSKK